MEKQRNNSVLDFCVGKCMLKIMHNMYCNSILLMILFKLLFTTTFFVKNISFLEPVKNPQQVADVYLAMFVCTLVFLAAITLLAIFYAFRYLFNSSKYHAMFVGAQSFRPCLLASYLPSLLANFYASRYVTP
jgi:hypothetical protein